MNIVLIAILCCLYHGGGSGEGHGSRDKVAPKLFCAVRTISHGRCDESHVHCCVKLRIHILKRASRVALLNLPFRFMEAAKLLAKSCELVAHLFNVDDQ